MNYMASVIWLLTWPILVFASYLLILVFLNQFNKRLPKDETHT